MRVEASGAYLSLVPEYERDRIALRQFMRKIKSGNLVQVALSDDGPDPKLFKGIVLYAAFDLDKVIDCPVCGRSGEYVN